MILPVEPYVVSDKHWKFGDKVPRRFGIPAVHLGDDVVVEAGTPVSAVGDGEVVFAKTIEGSEKRRSWGGVVIVKHEIRNPKSETNLKSEYRNNKHGGDDVSDFDIRYSIFYSIYGHMADLKVGVGDNVSMSDKLGAVAGSYTPENGWWKMPHLHFGIYTGPWRGEILPGYWRPERFWRTNRTWWHDPRKFIS